MDEREVYPNAAVVLVALEVRHPATGPLSAMQRTEVKARLAKRTPIMRVGQLQQVTAAIGAAPEVRAEDFPRYFNRDNTVAVSMHSMATVIETTRYARWEELLDLAAQVFQARHDIAPVDGLERVGLRYVNEVRVPDGDDWSAWVDSSLLGPSTHAAELGLAVERWQGVTAFTPADHFSLVLRYGPRIGYAVEPGRDLRRSAPPPGPFFLMDIDSFWMPPDGTPEFEVESLVEVCHQLHAPVRSLFERLITERTRGEVLRGGR